MKLINLLLLRLLAIGMVVSLAGTACTEKSSFPKPPISVPVKIDQLGVIADLRFEVNAHDVYHYFLEFKFPEGDQAEMARLRKQMGGTSRDPSGKLREPGVPVPTKLAITKIEGGAETPFYLKEIDPTLSGWGSDFFIKRIGYCDLPPGKYRARVESQRLAKEFSSTPVNFVIRNRAFTSFDAEKVDRTKSCPQ